MNIENLENLRIDTKEVSVWDIISRIEYNELVFEDKDYANAAMIVGVESRVIERMLVHDIPNRPLYFMEKDVKWECISVYASHVLPAIKHFVVDKTLKLVDLDYLKDLTTMGYDNLHPKYQRRITNSRMLFHVIYESTPDKIKEIILNRIALDEM
jgi:hypothetical protein